MFDWRKTLRNLRKITCMYGLGRGQDGPGFESRYKQEIFLVSKTSRQSLGPTILFFSGYRGSFFRDNADGA
jgi:hypothetical protein